jgi:hypothetical protein
VCPVHRISTPRTVARATRSDGEILWTRGYLA